MSDQAAIISPMLKRSNDRKVTNLVSKNGKTSTIANTFGLPAGKAFSCPGATSICESVCYAGKLEKVYKGVRDVLIHNWNLLKDADEPTMVDLLENMINEFRKDCEKKNAKLLFRIHWDGDFFNDTYARAWQYVILNNTDIQFWVYTRVKSAALILDGIENLSLYYSTDDENKDIAHDLRKTGTKIRLAYLGKTFAVTENTMKELIGKPGAKCPENNKSIPLISTNGSACVSCGLCVYGKADIRFSASKK
jgi:ferredoxin